MLGYNPYDNGRWYRFFIESDGSTITLTESDIESASIESLRLNMPSGFVAMDIKYDIHSIVASGSNALNFGQYLRGGGNVAITLPNKVNFDYAYIYVFGYFNED